MKRVARCILKLSWFEYAVAFLIVINSILIGVELDYQHRAISIIQQLILLLFTFEIAIRWLGKNSVKEYITSGWNWFDIFLVGISYMPDDWFGNAEIAVALRILRLLRTIRLLKAFPELQIIARVLLRSITSLFHCCGLILLTVYLYSLVGVILFRGKSEVITGIGAVTDPFASVTEAMFSMFRVLTGEDWTDLRYDLLTHSSRSYDGLVTIFFVSFFIVSAFLLINIVVGAIVNNFDQVMNEAAATQSEREKKDFGIDDLSAKLDTITTQLDSFMSRDDSSEERN